MSDLPLPDLPTQIAQILSVSKRVVFPPLVEKMLEPYTAAFRPSEELIQSVREQIRSKADDQELAFWLMREATIEQAILLFAAYEELLVLAIGPADSPEFVGFSTRLLSTPLLTTLLPIGVDAIARRQGS
jgi:hypothetical protein